jgi:methionine aminopeptidase
LYLCSHRASLSLYFSLCPTSHRDIGEAINVVTKATKNKAKGTMQPGHIFTIEPMINLGKG